MSSYKNFFNEIKTTNLQLQKQIEDNVQFVRNTINRHLARLEEDFCCETPLGIMIVNSSRFDSKSESLIINVDLDGVKPSDLFSFIYAIEDDSCRVKISQIGYVDCDKMNTSLAIVKDSLNHCLQTYCKNDL